MTEQHHGKTQLHGVWPYKSALKLTDRESVLDELRRAQENRDQLRTLLAGFYAASDVITPNAMVELRRSIATAERKVKRLAKRLALPPS